MASQIRADPPSGRINIRGTSKFKNKQCFFCQHPGLKANSEQMGSKCSECMVDRNGYQLTEGTPIVIDVADFPGLAKHNLYVDYPLPRIGCVKWVCRSCGMQDLGPEDFLPACSVFSRAPFLRMRVHIARHLEIQQHTQQWEDLAACSSSQHLS